MLFREMNARAIKDAISRVRAHIKEREELLGVKEPIYQDMERVCMAHEFMVNGSIFWVFVFILVIIYLSIK